MRAVSAFGAQILVLDDGFHHHRLARDLDLLGFDGDAGLGNRRVAPRGPLREFPSALRLADALVVIDGPLHEADQVLLDRLAPVWLTTEKDAVKILPSWVGRADVRMLAIEMVVEDSGLLCEWLEDRLREKPIGRDAALTEVG
jgi:tetraacyldisaccharide-1-P 4'-kinase